MIAKTSSVIEFVYLLAVISISLGISNLLPIPGLDGGKLLLLIIEAIRGKKLKQNTELIITSLGVLILCGIAVIVTTKDIGNLLG